MSITAHHHKSFTPKIDLMLNAAYLEWLDGFQILGAINALCIPTDQ
jgi:hypothetical protein